MIKNDKVYFIDFQGMRFGLPHYDLASLLLDPYVDLKKEEIKELYLFYKNQVISKLNMRSEDFDQIYHLCAIQRLMHCLGAYGFLGQVRKKKHFLQYIPKALVRLNNEVKEYEFSALKEIISCCIKSMKF
jgi:hypothetical protein